MKMAKALNPQIEKILKETSYLPTIFQSVLHSEGFFLEGEEIIDCLCFEREGYDVKSNFIVKHDDWHPTVLVIATNYGISVLEEGGSKISDTLFGYKVIHILYERIARIELDVCFLSGKLTISTGESQGGDTVIPFNTANYYQECERFIETTRKKIFESLSRV